MQDMFYMYMLTSYESAPLKTFYYVLQNLSRNYPDHGGYLSFELGE